MKKIAVKLFLYFVAALVSLSIILGGVFFLLFKNHVIKNNKELMTKKAESIAKVCSDNFMDGFFHFDQKNDYVSFIRWLDETEDTDAWIIVYAENSNKLLIIADTEDPWSRKDASSLPDNAYSVIMNVLNGKTTSSESFSSALGTRTLTVGAPIYIGANNVFGVVLLHSPVSNLQDVYKSGLLILAMSLVIALILSIILSLVFSWRFTKPLKMMRNTAVALAEKDYTAKTGIKRKDELGELASSMDTLADVLAVADKEQAEYENLRREYVANVSHELRTPVTVIKSSLEALNDEVVTDPSEVRQYYKEMLTEASVMQDMVNDLLELSRLQNAHFDIRHDILSLREVASDASRAAAKLCAEKNISIHKDLPDTPCIFKGDYARLRQLLLILFDNARKFSPEGSAVSLTLSENNEGYTFTVQDRGTGIPPENLTNIFERFVKSQSSDNKTGTGLGLAIAKETVTRHGGTIRAANVEKDDPETNNKEIAGAIFTIELPKNCDDSEIENIE